MPQRDIIVIGASAGGVEALTQLVSGPPADLPAAIFVVLHVPSHSTSALPQILSRYGPLPAVHANDGEVIATGRITVARPDFHLMLGTERIVLSRGPRENNHRPAIDPLFRSAARAYGSRVIGIVLSGTQDDGTAGLQAIKMRGGTAVVMDPDEALYPGMPRSAITNVDIDYVLPIAGICDLLVRLTSEPPPSARLTSHAMPASHEMKIEIALANADATPVPDTEHPGTPSTYGCPDCGGTLWEIHEGEITRFRCRTGHSWSAESLLMRQNDTLEEALWSAVRALEESASLARRMAERMRQRGYNLPAQRFLEQSEDSINNANLIRQVLAKGTINHALTTDGDLYE